MKIEANQCKIEQHSGKEAKIFVPHDADDKETKRITNYLSDHFDLVISTPTSCQRYEDRDDAQCKGIEITAIRKKQRETDQPEQKFIDLGKVLEVVWPSSRKVDRPTLRGTADDIVIHERRCEDV